MIKFITPCALLLALAAASAVHAGPVRCDNRVAAAQASERDPSLDQLAADARAVWHELTPDVREMVDELLVSRCEAAQRVSAVPPLPGRRASATRPA